MTNHPYPKPVVESVAIGMYNAVSENMHRLRSFEYAPKFVHDKYRGLAEAALQALWEASRVDDYETLAQVPDGTVIRDAEGYFGMKIRPGLWTEFFDDDHMHTSESAFYIPAHILHWGNHDR